MFQSVPTLEEWVCVTWSLTSRPGTTSASPAPPRTGWWSGSTTSTNTSWSRPGWRRRDTSFRTAPATAPSSRWSPSLSCVGGDVCFQAESVSDYSYPDGRVWSQLFTAGRYSDPSLAKKQLPMINDRSQSVKKPPMFEGDKLGHQ